MITMDDKCASCYQAGKGLEGEDLRIALVNVKFRLQAKAGIGRVEPEKADKEIPVKHVDFPGTAALGREPEKPTKIITEIITKIENTPEVSLKFESAKDQELLKTVWQMAAEQRRTVEQQILWMIEQAA
jgi:hypothetical protein